MNIMMIMMCIVYGFMLAGITLGAMILVTAIVNEGTSETIDKIRSYLLE